MPKFTIEATYNLPVYRHTTYEADTVEEACRMAMEDDDWEGAKEDNDSSGPTYITGAWAGEEDYVGDNLPIPADLESEDPVAAAAPEMLAVLKKIDAINGSTGGPKAMVAEFKFLARQAINKAEGR